MALAQGLTKEKAGQSFSACHLLCVVQWEKADGKMWDVSQAAVWKGETNQLSACHWLVAIIIIIINVINKYKTHKINMEQ